LATLGFVWIDCPPYRLDYAVIQNMTAAKPTISEPRPATRSMGQGVNKV
jgi:hypothetical protein